MGKISLIILAVVAVNLVDLVAANSEISAKEWANYKAIFNKHYTNSNDEEIAQFYYALNKMMIDSHNDNYYNGSVTYKLAINQFTDMPQIHCDAFFPVTIPTVESKDSPPPKVREALTTYDPTHDFGFIISVENQGTKCNSGWAYATAKSVELLKACQEGDKTPLSLSAQNLIDCANCKEACTIQAPQAAFDYLTQHHMGLLLEYDYNNNNTLSEPSVCKPRGELAANLISYSRLTDGDDESLKAYVSNCFPVVVEFNPTSFDFMHYAGGIFQQPATRQGSHFMVVIGYGTDETTGLDYWLLQNSFGTDWGENGFMKLLRTDKVKLTKNAIFPTELA